MKCIFFLLFTTICTNFCLAEGDERNELPQPMVECLKENGLDSDFFKKIFVDNETALMEKAKCLSFCMMEKTNLLDDSKHIKIDEFKKRMTLFIKPEEAAKLEKIVEMCPDIKSEMNCEKAINLDKCIAGM